MTNSTEKLTLRFRSPDASFTLAGMVGDSLSRALFLDLSLSMNLVELRRLVEERTGIPPDLQIFKADYPLRQLPTPEDPSAMQIGSYFPRGALVVVEAAPESLPLQVESAYQSGSFPVLPSSLDTSSEVTPPLEKQDLFLDD